MRKLAAAKQPEAGAPVLTSQARVQGFPGVSIGGVDSGFARRTTLFVQLSGIRIFPIKSLDGVAREESRITPGGILEHDREYAFFDEAGKQVKAKRNPRLHLLRTYFNPEMTEVAFRVEGDSATAVFPLVEAGRIGVWVGAYLGFPVTLRREPLKGFPDDTAAFGPTIVSAASLATVGERFPGLSMESIRRRFRTNLEVAGMEAFGEDRLFRGQGENVPFTIGSVRILGSYPCQRCPVPARDPMTSEEFPGFLETFSEARERGLPDWADRSRFNHFYRFAVNTSIEASEAGKTVRVGDPVGITPR